LTQVMSPPHRETVVMRWMMDAAGPSSMTAAVRFGSKHYPPRLTLTLRRTSGATDLPMMATLAGPGPRRRPPLGQGAPSTPPLVPCRFLLLFRSKRSCDECDERTRLLRVAWFSAEDSLAEKITSLFNLIAAGKVPPTIIPLLTAGRGVALPKASGVGLRPVVVGSIILRFVGTLGWSSSPLGLRHTSSNRSRCSLLWVWPVAASS